MLNFCLSAFIISTIVSSSSDRQRIHPKKFEITNADDPIFVDVPAVMGQSRAGINGKYAQLLEARSTEETSFFQRIEKECGTQWTRMGQWRTNGIVVRYLFVFKASQAVAQCQQRLIIASFEIKMSAIDHIEHLIIFDTEKARPEDSLIKFSILKPKPSQHATNSVSDSGSVQRQITPEVQSNARTVEGLSRALRDAEAKLSAQSVAMTSIVAHRDRLQKKVDEMQMELSENAQSAKCDIEKLQNQIALDHDEMAQWKDVIRDQRNEIDGLRTAQVLAEKSQNVLHVHD